MQTNYALPINSKITASAQDIAFMLHSIYTAMKNPVPRLSIKDHMKEYMKDIGINCKYIVNIITDEIKRDTEQTAAIHKHL